MNVGPDECRRHSRGLELDAHPLDRVSHDSLMVERQLELPVQDVGHGREAGVRGVGARHDVSDVSQHREVGDRDDVHARVAAGIAVGAELRQHARGIDAGLLAELALRGLVERLGRALEASGDRPHVLERRLATSDEQHVQHPAGHGQDHDVDRDGEGWELGWVVAGGRVGFGVLVTMTITVAQCFGLVD